jgi:hypothetical protein
MARFLAAICFFRAVAFAEDCISFEKAHEHVGKTKCVRGMVLKVTVTYSGSHFLDFCEDYKTCPFTVVVFRRNLPDVGDVRVLEGKEIEINGKIKNYQGRAEIILKDQAQLRGQATKLPPVPANYDADRRGNFSAGTFTNNRSKHPTHRRTSRPSDGEIDAE